MTEMCRMKGYITYPMDLKIRGILLNKYTINCVQISMNGYTHKSKKPVPEDLLSDMIERGAKIERFEDDVYRGKENIFGIPDTKSQTVAIRGSKYIRIRVIGNNLDDLMSKISDIKKKMLAYGVQSKVCVWNRVGKVVTRPIVQEQPKVVPEFDSSEVKNRRGREIQAARQK